MTWHIYSLTDPRDGRIRYVGKANNIKRRLCCHIHESLHSQKRNHRLNWIRSLVEIGQMPHLCILESGEGDWQEAEKRWIKTFRDAGYELVNATDGGEGVEGRVISEETRARLSAGVRSSRRVPGAMDRLNAAAQSPEARAKRSASQKLAWQDPGKKARWRAALKGHPVSAETRAKIRVAAKARCQSPEVRAKMSAAAKARWEVAQALLH